MAGPVGAAHLRGAGGRGERSRRMIKTPVAVLLLAAAAGRRADRATPSFVGRRRARRPLPHEVLVLSEILGGPPPAGTASPTAGCCARATRHGSSAQQV